MSKRTPPPPGAAKSSSWNDSGSAFAPNTNVLDCQSMPSATAAAARAKSAKVMAALKSGEKGAADKAMGDFEGRSAARGVTPLGMLFDKIHKRVKKGREERRSAGEGEGGRVEGEKMREDGIVR